MSGEGETRKPDEQESDKLCERRNSYFVPMERLARQAQPFARLQTLRYAGAAHFGQEAIKPIDAISQVHAGIMSTVGILIEIAKFADDPTASHQLIPHRQSLGWGPRSDQPDPTERKIQEAVTAIET
ncbi:MAG: hypothetical protein ACREQD_05885, partial [Candidatus Binataceae bacterium]